MIFVFLEILKFVKPVGGKCSASDGSTPLQLGIRFLIKINQFVSKRITTH